jgi:hypothetical protein
MKSFGLHSSAGRALALAALCGLLLLRVPYAASHMDLARDMWVTWRLLQGQAFPLEGPVLNGMIHLGPVWYYILAVLLLLGRSWFGTMLLLGLLASLQIPLAYLLGKELHSRRAGMLWAVGLVVPSWTTYSWMLPLHPILSPLFLLAFVLCCLRYWRSGARKYFYGMALAFTLALHAHPSNIGCAWIGLFVVLRARHPRVTWRDFALAALLVLAPLLPFFYADAQRGFEDFRKSFAFAANPEATGSLANLPSLFLAIVYGGTRYLFDPLSGLSAHAAQAAACVIALGGVGGGVGVFFALRDRRTRAATLFVIGSMLVVLATVAVMRSFVPYYMTTAARVLLAGLVAIGLSALGENGVARALRTAVACSAVLACIVTTYGNARFQSRGAWPFAWVPMFDVAHAPETVTPLLLTPAYAMDTSGRFLCAEPNPSIHGSYGNQLIHNYAMDMRLSCGRSDVHVGGDESGRSHWLGLSRAMLAQSGVQPQLRVGPIGLLRPRRIVSSNPPLLQAAEPRYPAYLPRTETMTTRQLSVPLQAGEHLAISNLAFAFNVEPRFTVSAAGKTLAPVARDRVAEIYACPDCAPGQSVLLQVQISSADHFDIDIVVF